MYSGTVSNKRRTIQTMKKTIILLILCAAGLLNMPLPALAQQGAFALSDYRIILPQIAVGNTSDTWTIPAGLTSHVVTWRPSGNVTGLTVTVSATTDGRNYATINTSTAMNGSLAFTGNYYGARISMATVTAATPPFDVVYDGTNPQGQASLITGLNGATPVPVSVDSSGYVNVNASVTSGGVTNATLAAGQTIMVGAGSGSTYYTTPVNSGITTITSGSTTTLLAATTAVQAIWCANLTASSVNLTITDGSNSYYVGPNFPLTANNNGALINIPGGLIMASGVKASAGTASAVNCQVVGKQ